MIGLPEAVLTFGGALITVIIALSLVWRDGSEKRRRGLEESEKIAAAMTEIYDVSNESIRVKNRTAYQSGVVIKTTETVKSTKSVAER